MNANEILDELKYVTKVLNMNTDVDTKPLVEAATMLRQQQAEIEALKQIIDANNLNQNIGQFVKPTNEPVGVVCEFEGTLVGTLFEQLPDGTKLYTHPVKELTDEAIITVADPLNLWDVPKDKLIDFARAILRKAQEK